MKEWRAGREKVKRAANGRQSCVDGGTSAGARASFQVWRFWELLSRSRPDLWRTHAVQADTFFAESCFRRMFPKRVALAISTRTPTSMVGRLRWLDVCTTRHFRHAKQTRKRTRMAKMSACFFPLSTHCNDACLRASMWHIKRRDPRSLTQHACTMSRLRYSNELGQVSPSARPRRPQHKRRQMCAVGSRISPCHALFATPVLVFLQAIEFSALCCDVLIQARAHANAQGALGGDDFGTSDMRPCTGPTHVRNCSKYIVGLERGLQNGPVRVHGLRIRFLFRAGLAGPLFGTGKFG